MPQAGSLNGHLKESILTGIVLYHIRIRSFSVKFLTIGLSVKLRAVSKLSMRRTTAPGRASYGFPGQTPFAAGSDHCLPCQKPISFARSSNASPSGRYLHPLTLMPCQQCDRQRSELKVREREHIMAVQCFAEVGETHEPDLFTKLRAKLSDARMEHELARLAPFRFRRLGVRLGTYPATWGGASPISRRSPLDRRAQ